MDNEVVFFCKDGFIEGKCVDFDFYLVVDWQGVVWFVWFKLVYCYIVYQLDDYYLFYGYGGCFGVNQVLFFIGCNLSCVLLIVSFDMGLIFDCSVLLFGISYIQMLELRLYYLYVLYCNQDNFLLFDMGLLSFDYWQLFLLNQFFGVDCQMNVNNFIGVIIM